MGLLGKLFGSGGDVDAASVQVGDALRAAGYEPTYDTWNGWMFVDRGRPVAIALGKEDWADLSLAQAEEHVGRGPDAPILWNEEPGVSREVFVDDEGAPDREHLLRLVVPALAPIAEAGAFSMRIDRSSVIAAIRTQPPVDPAAITQRLLGLLPTFHAAMDQLEAAYASWTNVVEP